MIIERCGLPVDWIAQTQNANPNILELALAMEMILYKKKGHAFDCAGMQNNLVLKNHNEITSKTKQPNIGLSQGLAGNPKSLSRFAPPNRLNRALDRRSTEQTDRESRQYVVVDR